MSLKFLSIITLVIGFSILSVFNLESVQASHNNVSGWAWGGTTDNNLGSGNCASPTAAPYTTDCGGIGWISLNHSNTGAAINYGINIPNFPFTGANASACTSSPCPITAPNNYIWSSNVGWIQLDPAGPYPALPNASTEIVSHPTQTTWRLLRGWARIVSIPAAGTNAGGWEGWIKMSGNIPAVGDTYGVELRPIPGNPGSYSLINFAWSNELGWIKFDGTVGPTSGGPSCTISALPNSGAAPLSGSLNYTTSNNPTSCSLTGGPFTGSIPAPPPSSGSVNYGPLANTTTYTLTCLNAASQQGSCSTTVTVGGGPALPDLVVQSLTFSPISPSPGNSMTFSGTVVNQGTASAGASETRLRIDINNDGSWNVTPALMTTGSLAPSASEIETWSGAWTAVPGTHKFEICADAGNAGAGVVGESNEGNNCTELIFTVSPPGGQQVTCTGSPSTAFIGIFGSSAKVRWTARDQIGNLASGVNWAFGGGANPSTSSLNPADVRYTTTGQKNAAIQGASPSVSCFVNVRSLKLFEIRP